MQHDAEQQIDKSQWLPDGEPLITPERAAKGDVFTGPDCSDCGATGKDKMTKLTCKTCRGKGWVGSTNAATIDAADIRFAQVHQRNLLFCLWDSNNITDQQKHDCETFQIWRDMHRVQMGLGKPVSSGGEETFSVRLRAYGYILIIRRMSRQDNDTIETALCPMLSNWGDWISRNSPERYVTALERLSRLLPPIKDQIAHLEGLSEEERNTLSELQMKKFIDHCNKRV